MEQTFVYPNLLSGTRTGKGWTRTGGIVGNGFDIGTGLELYNKKASECFLWSPGVVLHTGRTYTLSFYAASTDNMASTDIFVLDNGGFSDDYKWIGASKLVIKPPAGGGVDHMDVHALLACAGRRGLQCPLRQQRHHGQQTEPCLVPRHHALRIGRAARMGTGRRGGVALDER